jgi:hypothetical protein
MMKDMNGSDIGRFWGYVTVRKQEECWEWFGATDSTGHGTFGYHWYSHKKIGRTTGAHRVSWFLFHGEEIAKTDVIMHSCDNPICVNPGHLKKGTQKKNMEEMSNRGRGRSVVTWADACRNRINANS